MENKTESGIRRTVWLPRELDAKVEEARKLLGLGRSGFYRFAIVETLKSLLTVKREAEAG
ncbi:hypothetical protein KEJ37_06910 [Candidatus Bathyarchaeota archaeon]|nr:hypothetical protein [Candidatus Bathyarchaeota archaeon]